MNPLAEPASDGKTRFALPEGLMLLRRLPRRLAVWCIRAYQITAPMRPAVCRFHPSCSEYTAQCLLKHGVFVGVALGIRRILRCNPLSSGGYDPIP